MSLLGVRLLQVVGSCGGCGAIRHKWRENAKIDTTIEKTAKYTQHVTSVVHKVICTL